MALAFQAALVQMSQIRIGTRGSALALAQAGIVRDQIVVAHGLDKQIVEIVPIRTTGDKILDRNLAEIGGKGLFTKEIELALLAGSVDLAVHSMKDMPAILPDGLAIEAVLKREDPRDAFISPKASKLQQLAQGALVGSSSVRRRAQIKRLRPDLKLKDFRGNVETRLRKLADGEVDAIFLACAGLKRLGLERTITSPVEPGEMLPAVAQGAIGIETAKENTRIRDLIAPLNDPETAWCILAERSFLLLLEGSCRTPIAGLATIVRGRLNFRGMIISPDGKEVHETGLDGAVSDAAALGEEAGRELKARAGAAFFAGL